MAHPHHHCDIIRILTHKAQTIQFPQILRQWRHVEIAEIVWAVLYFFKQVHRRLVYDFYLRIGFNENNR